MRQRFGHHGFCDQQFPSPGGDVLRRCPGETPISWPEAVSVPWRGCVASQTQAGDAVVNAVSVPWRGCVASDAPLRAAGRSGVSVPWRGCVASLRLLRHISSTAAFPSPGGDVLRPGCHFPVKPQFQVSVPWRGCVASGEKRAVYPASQNVSVPWRGCVASRRNRKLARGGRLFPSPGGDVLRRGYLGLWVSCSYWFPSPGGDVLRPANRLQYMSGKEGFRPLAGMCCVLGPRRMFLRRIRRFPSPGGDVLRLDFLGALSYFKRVSVPWRGCVASVRGVHLAADSSSFRPLAGMCCVHRLFVGGVFQRVSVPWRGCVASANLHKTIFQKGIFSCFPLPFCNIL